MINKNILILSALCSCCSLWADEVVVRHYNYAGPYEVKKPSRCLLYSGHYSGRRKPNVVRRKRPRLARSALRKTPRQGFVRFGKGCRKERSCSIVPCQRISYCLHPGYLPRRVSSPRKGRHNYNVARQPHIVTAIQKAP